MALDDNDWAEIKKLVADAVKPLSDSLGGLDELLGKKVKAVVDGLDLEGKIASALEKAPGGKGKGKGKRPEADGDDDPVAAELAELKEQLARRDEALQAAESKARTERLHGAARDALAKSGVPASRVNVALAVLRDQLHVDGDKMGVRGKDRFGADTIVPFDEAIPAWLKTEEGKLFVGPTGGGGTGHTAGRGAGAGDGKPADLDSLKDKVLGAVVRTAGQQL